jgi:4-hydroxy-tetrahydrodipicolinate reductase
MATTGLSQSQMKTLHQASKETPVFFSANMSLGVNLLIDLVKKAAKVLEDNFDIEIVEKHHNQKIDAPSGTALAIADEINSVLKEKHEYEYDRHSKRKKRSKNEIGIHAVRGGTIVGDHSVIFAGTDEIIEINHIAMSKEIFAVGAVRAAKFLKGKAPGFYSMDDLIEES